MSDKSEQLRKIRQEFIEEKDDWMFIKTITAFIQWATLTGNYPAAASARRFINFINGGSDEDQSMAG